MIRFAEEDNSSKKKAGIKVVGLGGGGGNAVSRMLDKDMSGVEFIICNTDLQALNNFPGPVKIQIGRELCNGLGAGGAPAIGEQAALEQIEEIKQQLEGADMVFITAGMGGGTGTGSAPVVAGAAKELGALTVGVVTKPFQFEGGYRMEQAEQGIRELSKRADTLLVIQNEKLLETAAEDTTIQEGFSMADDVLYKAVRGISDLITIPGYINLDFADVKRIMAEMGMTLMGTAEAEGKERAIQAVKEAIECPLLEDLSIEGARGILINITGGPDMTLKEINDASTYIFEASDREANIIWGYVVSPEYEGKIKITVIATGLSTSGFKTSESLNIKKEELPPPEEEEDEQEPALVTTAAGNDGRPDEMPDVETPQPVPTPVSDESEETEYHDNEETSEDNIDTLEEQEMPASTKSQEKTDNYQKEAYEPSPAINPDLPIALRWKSIEPYQKKSLSLKSVSQDQMFTNLYLNNRKPYSPIMCRLNKQEAAVNG